MLDSRFGKLFIIAYALFAIVMPSTVFFCGFEGCGHYLVYPIMPWAFIFTQDFGFDFPWAVYPVLLLLNVSVAYAIGAILEWLYHIYTDRRK